MKSKARTSAIEKKAALVDLPDYTPTTDAHIERLADLLPPAAFYAVREEIDRCRPRSPARYAVAVLSAWHREGRYA